MLKTVVTMAPRSFALYVPMAAASVVMTVLTWVLMCWVIATVSMVTGRNVVPWLGWFYTHDASLDGGVEQGKDGYDPAAKGFKLWWQRVCWICRNPAYGFVAGPLGYSAEGSAIIFQSGSPYPPVKHWVVIKLKGGRRLFGYRDGGKWFGWKHTAIAGRHQLKSKPF